MTRPGRRLRVLRLLPELDFGGVESLVTLQAALHARDEFELRVCTFHKAGAAARNIQSLGVDVHSLDQAPSVRNPAATLTLANYLRHESPDILHASIAEANFHALLVARLLAVPVVIAEETGMPAHSKLAQLAFRGLYHTADAIIGVTRAVCDYVRDVDGAPPDRVELVYNCASAGYFPPERRKPNAEVPAHLLAVGRLTPVKNHQLLIRAFADVVRQRPDARLSIVGEGPLREPTAQLIEQLGLQTHVTLHGYRDDVRAMLASSRGFLLPSTSEGCSVSLIEAMATGIPAIVSSVPGNIEVLGEELASSWTASPGSAWGWTQKILELLNLSSERWQTVATEAQARAYALFSPTAYVSRVESLYRRLAARRRLQ